jgi:hypothetical protein
MRMDRGEEKEIYEECGCAISYRRIFRVAVQ